MNRILYLPMEIASRELDARLLLSVVALLQGFEVVLGQKWLIESNIKRMSPGVYLSKTMTRRDAHKLARARALGYFTAAIDEELPGLVTRPDELRWISPEATAETEAIFISGEGNTQSFIGRFPDTEARVSMALNPRWDLLRPELRSIFDGDVSSIRQRYGEFILINTNLGFTNSEKGSWEEIFKDQVRLGKIDANNANDISYVDSICAMEMANKEAILEIVARLRQTYPSRTVIIRPHPSERLALWAEAFSGDAKVNVVREGSAIPWIIASTLLIHTNCTTGTEALALGKPAICVMPTDAAVTARYLSNRVNPVARSVEQALEISDHIISNSAAPVYTAQMVDIFRHAMSYREDRFGAQIIVEELVRKLDARSDFSSRIPSSSTWRPYRKYHWHIPNKNVRGDLFPSLDREMVKERLLTIARLLGADLAPHVDYCGSKALLIGTHPMRPYAKLRRFLSGARVNFRDGTPR